MDDDSFEFDDLEKVQLNNPVERGLHNRNPSKNLMEEFNKNSN